LKTNTKWKTVADILCGAERHGVGWDYGNTREVTESSDIKEDRRLRDKVERSDV
jgi:hypothetical protein